MGRGTNDKFCLIFTEFVSFPEIRHYTIPPLFINFVHGTLMYGYIKLYTLHNVRTRSQLVKIDYICLVTEEDLSSICSFTILLNIPLWRCIVMNEQLEIHVKMSNILNCSELITRSGVCALYSWSYGESRHTQLRRFIPLKHAIFVQTAISFFFFIFLFLFVFCLFLFFSFFYRSL